MNKAKRPSPSGKQVVQAPQPTQPANLASHKATTIVRAEFQGPLPHPGHLQGYENILPGSAERILAMAEKQQHHDHSTQQLVITKYHLDYRRGQFFGLIVHVFAVGSGVLLAIYGEPTVGGAIAVAGLGSSIVSAFLSKDPEKNKKDDE
jgi:uncharacterized membrane protein